MDPNQFHRCMTDYFTRNLQRDLLEIAETYQSTIRHEVDGLRGQIIQMRRKQADESVNWFVAFNRGSCSSRIREGKMWGGWVACL